MRLIDADCLYKKVVELELQALSMVMKSMDDEDFSSWRFWQTVLTERTSFKFDVVDSPTVDAVPVMSCADGDLKGGTS